MGSPRRTLIVVSNRGPVSYSRDEAGERVARRGGGGLATALRGLVAHHEVTWIASAMTDEDRAVAAEAGGEAFEEQDRAGSPYRVRLVAHDPTAYDLAYNEVANGVFWFLQHYLWGLASAPDLGTEFRAAWRDGYEPVNRGFAAAVLGELERSPGAAVFFHDYHLYLCPALVRTARPDARLAHFVHIPWPEPDYWRVLPEDVRRAVHDGLCANDVVGFHTHRWRRSFLESCAAIGGRDVDRAAAVVAGMGRRTHAAVRPIAIEPSEFDALRESPAVLAEEERIVAARPDRLVVRVDRTDPSKNVVRGFRAFALMLERYPEHAGRVGMLALLDPSRQDRPEYASYLEAIEREAAAVNERFAGGGRLPVDLQIGDNFPQAVAAYKQYDVLLVNPIFDGMNLVAKEAPLVNRRDGVVVLSENAGAHEELGEWTLTVNPFDLEQQAEALHEALVMEPGERHRRAAALTAYVREHDVEAWIAGQLDDLDRFAGPERGSRIEEMTELSHVDESSGDVTMVNVGHKPPMRRRAVARGTVLMAAETARRIRDLPKGDALATAQVAGILAAKRTSDLIPLCHPLPLTHAGVEFEVRDDRVDITAWAEVTSQTGVEMEALAAVSVAALTIYDMAKAIDKGMVISDVTLVEKTKDVV